jgi:hypothetical protein
MYVWVFTEKFRKWYDRWLTTVTSSGRVEGGVKQKMVAVTNERDVHTWFMGELKRCLYTPKSTPDYNYTHVFTFPSYH